ncbi:MAG TPA: hypothetical protein VLK29_05390, partial [Luteimonas sp.]|nr:hypothetical protein [Luteimonas sp.]
GVPTGILSTPVIDRARGRIYVTHCDPRNRWQAYALDLHTGDILAGWPVRLDEAALNRTNRNRGPQPVEPRRRHDFRVQRGALNLSPDGRWLYVTFGETETGWLVAVDTTEPRIGSAFAVAAMPHRGSGGIWGAGGPAVDVDGGLYVATGTGYGGYTDAADDWTQSILRLVQAPEGLRLVGTYTPFNHCLSAAADIDLGSGGPALLPVVGVSGHLPRLLAVGGKQGNVYLLDRDRLPGSLDRRPPCTTPSSRDGSLLPPAPQPQFAARGPLNVFGPYSEADAAMDLARSRSVPAAYVDAAGTIQVLVTGGSRRAEGDATSVAPSLVRLAVAGADGAAPYLEVARRQPSVAMRNPGSPVVTSEDGGDAVVWVLDENAPRSALLAGDGTLPRPILYAFDAERLDLLWSSAPGLLHTSGKYNSPAFGGGLVFVGTDRIQAFGAGGRNQPAARHGAVPDRPTPPATVADAPARRAQPADVIWRSRCAGCHDQASGNIPPRSLLSTRPRARIVAALTSGVMRAQASGLSPTEIAALADFLE